MATVQKKKVIQMMIVLPKDEVKKVLVHDENLKTNESVVYCVIYSR